MLTFIFAEFFEFYFGRTFRYTNTCAIVSVAAFATFKPDILPFTLFFSHKIRPNQAGLITNYLLIIQILARTRLAGFSTLLLTLTDSR
jgi:hypothetical protein